jgi:hypothetical protein
MREWPDAHIKCTLTFSLEHPIIESQIMEKQHRTHIPNGGSLFVAGIHQMKVPLF